MNSLSNNETPLAVAVRYENYEIVKLLVEFGVNDNLGDILLLSLELKNIEIIEYLLDRGVKPIKTSSNIEPLFAYEDEDEDDGYYSYYVTELLLSYGAILTTRIFFHFAEVVGLSFLKMLIGSKAYKNANIDLTDILFAAVINEDVMVFEYYLSIGAKIYDKYHEKDLIEYIVTAGSNSEYHIRKLRLLGLKPGKDILHKAISIYNNLAVSALLKDGFDLSLKNDNGLTPLELARKTGNHDIVHLLIKNGA